MQVGIRSTSQEEKQAVAENADNVFYAKDLVSRERAEWIGKVVDRLGGGDACVAGFLTGLLQGDIAYGVQLGNAFSALKHTSPTDWPWPTLAEAEALIASDQSQIKR